MSTKLLQPALCRAIKSPLEELIGKLQTVCACSVSARALSSLLQRHTQLLSTSGVKAEPRPLCTSDGGPETLLATTNDLLHCNDAAREDSRDMKVIPDFVSEEEEQSLLQDIGRTLRGKRYQYDHWDGAIEGYRETEKSTWTDKNLAVIERLKNATIRAVPGQTLTPLPEVHVLDLAKEGFIKPHIDSVKFCGEVIAGLSLLSPSVMQLQHEEDSERCIWALLPRLSLYIMRGVVRYRYNHAILAGDHSSFRGSAVPRERRISIICRTLPE